MSHGHTSSAHVLGSTAGSGSASLGGLSGRGTGPKPFAGAALGDAAVHARVNRSTALPVQNFPGPALLFIFPCDL